MKGGLTINGQIMLVTYLLQDKKKEFCNLAGALMEDFFEAKKISTPK